VCFDAVPNCGRSTSLTPDLPPDWGVFFRVFFVSDVVFQVNYTFSTLNDPTTDVDVEDTYELFDTQEEAEQYAARLSSDSDVWNVHLTTHQG